MERGPSMGIAIGAGIGALLGAVLIDYLVLDTGGFNMIRTFLGAAMIGATLGALLGWVLSRPSRTVEEVIGLPTRRTRIVMWMTSVMAIAFAFSAGIDGEFVEAAGWLALAGAWILQASGAAERVRAFLYLSGGVLLLGFLFLGTAFILGEL